MSAVSRVRHSAGLKLSMAFPSGWWLVPSILGGTAVWVAIGFALFG